MRSAEDRFWSKVGGLEYGIARRIESCWPWLGARKPAGYGNFYFRGKYISAHVMSWFLRRRTLPPVGCHVLHSCDNPPCVNPEHLFLGTNADNRRDSVAKMRHSFGERHARAKLSSKQVVILRELCRFGMPKTRVAELMGCSVGHVFRVLTGEKRRHG